MVARTLYLKDISPHWAIVICPHIEVTILTRDPGIPGISGATTLELWRTCGPGISGTASFYIPDIHVWGTTLSEWGGGNLVTYEKQAHSTRREQFRLAYGEQYRLNMGPYYRRRHIPGYDCGVEGRNPPNRGELERIPVLWFGEHDGTGSGNWILAGVPAAF